MREHSIFKGLILYLLLMGSVWADSEWKGQWSDPIIITEQTDTPDFEIDPATGNLHIVTMMTPSTNGGVMYTLMDSVGNIILSEEMPLVSGGIPGYNRDKGGWNFGATISVDGDGFPHVCYRVFKDRSEYIFDLYYIRRDASGWSSSVLVSSNVNKGLVVRMAVDGQGRAHIIQSELAMNIQDIPEPTSPWGAVKYYQVYQGQLVSEMTKMIHDPEWTWQREFRIDNRFEITATYEGHVHLVLGNPDRTRNKIGEIAYYYSLDGGSTFERFGLVQSQDTPRMNGDPDIQVDRVGNVHIGYGSHKDVSIQDYPSFRYVRISNGEIVKNVVTSQIGEIIDWGWWGFGSLASSDDGTLLMASYTRQDEDSLWTVHSSDGGSTWSGSTFISPSSGGQEGRNKHLIRAYKNHFYIVYPQKGSPWYRSTKLRIMRNVNDNLPIAHSGGPYFGNEGSAVQLNMSGSSDSGQNAGIREYAWDFDGDDVFEQISTSNQFAVTFEDDLEGDAILRVTDRAGHTVYDTTTVTIYNLNPILDGGFDITISEGDTATMPFTATDPGDDELTIEWEYGDGTVWAGGELSHVYLDNGRFAVAGRVTDDDGGVGIDTVWVTVKNVPPVGDAGGPYQGAAQDSIQLFASVTDKGILDEHTFQWDLNGDGSYENSLQNPKAWFEFPGEYVVRLRVLDDDGGVSLDSAVVTVTREKPVIQGQPSFTIDEGGSFPTIQLDDWVNDPDHSDDRMVWDIYGNDWYQVSLSERVLQVTPPDTNWFGEDTLHLVVTDPLSLKDTADVVFTVRPVNDAPFWYTSPDFLISFNEDDSLLFTYSDLMALVVDVDDDLLNLQLSVTGGDHVFGEKARLDSHWVLRADHNWNGYEPLILQAVDTSGAVGLEEKMAWVNAQPDPPDPFQLIEPMLMQFTTPPDSIDCLWNAATDPDSGDVIHYEWNFIAQGGRVIRQITTFDTAFTFYLPENLDYGMYLWYIIAYDLDMQPQLSVNKGTLVYEDTTSAVENVWIPTEFSLLQNYPNPFNPETRITYHLPKTSDVTLEVFNPLGQRVRMLSQGLQQAGVHQIIWDGKNRHGDQVPSGVYIYRMVAGGKVFFKKMMMIQ